MKEHENELVTPTENNDLLDKNMSNKMSSKEEERLTIIIDYLQKNQSIKKSEATNIEDKTEQRLLVKAVEPEILKVEGEYKVSIYKLKC